MGRSIGQRTGGLPMPVVPTENKGIMSGPIRKPRRQGRRMRPRGSRPDVQLGRVTQPDGSTLITYGSGPRRKEREGSIGRRPIRGGRMRSCPDPKMLILMSDDTSKKAGDLVIGDLVKTYHEKSFELGNYEVEFVDIIEDVEKIKLTFEDSEIVCSTAVGTPVSVYLTPDLGS